MVEQLNRARTLAKSGRLKEADRAFDEALKAHPRNVKVLAAAAEFHYLQTRLVAKALKAVEQLVRLRPKNADFRVLAVEILLQAQNRRQALVQAKVAAQCAPDALNVLIANAAALITNGQQNAALSFVEKALKKAPSDPKAMYQHAQILMFQGKAADALRVVEDILAKMPNAIEALAIYVTAQKLTDEDPVLVRMRDEMLPTFEANGDPRTARLLQLLGNAHDQIGAYETAFSYHERAKAKSPKRYSAKAYAGFVGALCAGVSRADFFARGSSDDAPVLIVGMPRTGSTLLEQVLASHPQIRSAGESLSLRRIVTDAGVSTHQGARMVQAIKEMPSEAATRLAQRYCTEIAQEGAQRVIDKSLHNFELLGFLAAMLPKAQVIHMKRDPMDTCVSCYMQALPATHNYTESLDALGHAYMQYRRLMDHWAKVLPNPMLSMSYEDLVIDLEGSARRAIDFLGLGWDDACLNYRQAENMVSTISVAQVRQPIYRSAMQRWQRYESALDPLKARLAPLYPQGFDKPAI